MFYQIFLSPKVKRSVIISNKHGIYKFLHELPNIIKLSILANYEISGKQLSAQASSQNKNYFNTSKELLKNRN